jgi:hypothetical protein
MGSSSSKSAAISDAPEAVVTAAASVGSLSNPQYETFSDPESASAPPEICALAYEHRAGGIAAAQQLHEDEVEEVVGRVAFGSIQVITPPCPPHASLVPPLIFSVMVVDLSCLSVLLSSFFHF